MLDVEQAKEIYESVAKHGRRVKRKFIGSELRRWNPRKPIAYSFDGSHSQLFFYSHFYLKFLVTVNSNASSNCVIKPSLITLKFYSHLFWLA